MVTAGYIRRSVPSMAVAIDASKIAVLFCAEAQAVSCITRRFSASLSKR
jgi:hypothetical protein